MKTFNLLLVNLGRTQCVPPQLALGRLWDVPGCGTWLMFKKLFSFLILILANLKIFSKTQPRSPTVLMTQNHTNILFFFFSSPSVLKVKEGFCHLWRTTAAPARMKERQTHCLTTALMYFCQQGLSLALWG